MERSSPLAAMRPPSMPGHWGQRHDRAGYDSNYLAPGSYQSHNFNFRDMSMLRPPSDYFTCKPVLESSPTSSLAVDLSRNFRIDQSPPTATPRRSLLQTFSKVGRAFGSLTPPIPSSSPGPESDLMDVSPLPHKPPHPVLIPIACSPTPAATPALMDPLLVPELVRSQSQPEGLNSPRQKRSFSLRPGLRKGLSTNNVPTNPKSSQATAFQFGPPLPPLPHNALECFAESPPSERKFPPSTSISSFWAPALTNGPCAQNGSPLSNSRRPIEANGRPLRQPYRRTQSMQYNNSSKVVRQEKRFRISTSSQVSIAVEESCKLTLPCFKALDTAEVVPRITKETLVNVLNGSFTDELGETIIIDCRFEYEYNGGHIEGAVNFNDKEELAKQLFNGHGLGKKTLILHCEYSAHRAPIMAKFIREKDRAINHDNYPCLTYPEVYILDGGYSAFFQAYSPRCFPQNYVEMESKEHESACELGMAKVRQRPRAKLNRAQTFAFGQTSTLPKLDEKKPLSAIEASTLSKLAFMDIDFAEPVQFVSGPFLANSTNRGHGPVTATRRLDSF